MERKLVTVRTVSELVPIEGADFIEIAKIDGWQCVVKKGEFAVGEKGLYFEIDSFLPEEDERFKFLEKNFTNYKNRRGARIRTIKLKGQLSQGLLLPLEDFPGLIQKNWGGVFDDKDYSEQLKVTKWEPPEANTGGNNKLTWLGRKTKKLKYTWLKPFFNWLEIRYPNIFARGGSRKFPDYIPKTDEERIQNLINKLDRTFDEFYEATVKLDGSSMTVYHNRGKTGVCSRNFELVKDPENKYWATALKYNIPDEIKKLGMNIAIQGELMGPGIQGNKEGLKTYDFFVYKIWDIDAHAYLSNVRRDITCANLGLKQVPSLGYHQLKEFPDINAFLAFSEGPSLCSEMREGVVFSKLDCTHSFKVVSNSFLLKYKE